MKAALVFMAVLLLGATAIHAGQCTDIDLPACRTRVNTVQAQLKVARGNVRWLTQRYWDQENAKTALQARIDELEGLTTCEDKDKDIEGLNAQIEACNNDKTALCAAWAGGEDQSPAICPDDSNPPVDPNAPPSPPPPGA